MKGLALIIVGYQGAGKTLLAKDMLSGVHPDRIWVLDINKEYTEFPGCVKHPNGRPDFDKYIELMIEDEGKIFVTEDATTVFSHRGYDPRLVQAVISKRHSENVYIFLFHSLRVIPRDVFEYSDELWLLKTADTDDSVMGKYKGTGVQELLNEVRALPEFEWSKRQPLPKRDVHYKVLQIKKGKVDKTVTRTKDTQG